MAIEASEPSTVALRNTLRQTFRERRRSLNRSEQAAFAQQLVQQSEAQHLFIDVQNVGLYMTNDGELDTKPLIEYLWNKGVHVYLPVLHPFSDGHLLFLEYTRHTPMRANHFGILEPKLDCSKICPVNQLDILFTPLVAFDEFGNRLGMGGGFYDRTLAAVIHNQKRQTRVIGIAHDIQKTLSLPTQAWDIPLPYVLTPSRLYNCTD